MRYISKILKTFGLAACAGLVTTSCDVELMPLNEVVLENYWTDKSDVESVLNSCYTAMQSGSWITHVVTWGEVRSDNIVVGEDVPTYLQDIIKGNLKQSNEACQWVSLYTAINYCNTLIYYAPQVAEKDPNLTTADLNSYVAQAKRRIMCCPPLRTPRFSTPSSWTSRAARIRHPYVTPPRPQVRNT